MKRFQDYITTTNRDITSTQVNLNFFYFLLMFTFNVGNDTVHISSSLVFKNRNQTSRYSDPLTICIVHCTSKPLI